MPTCRREQAQWSKPEKGKFLKLCCAFQNFLTFWIFRDVIFFLFRPLTPFRFIKQVILTLRSSSPALDTGQETRKQAGTLTPNTETLKEGPLVDTTTAKLFVFLAYLRHPRKFASPCSTTPFSSRETRISFPTYQRPVRIGARQRLCPSPRIQKKRAACMRTQSEWSS